MFDFEIYYENTEQTLFIYERIKNISMTLEVDINKALALIIVARCEQQLKFSPENTKQALDRTKQIARLSEDKTKAVNILTMVAFEENKLGYSPPGRETMYHALKIIESLEDKMKKTLFEIFSNKISRGRKFFPTTDEDLKIPFRRMERAKYRS